MYSHDFGCYLHRGDFQKSNLGDFYIESWPRPWIPTSYFQLSEGHFWFERFSHLFQPRIYEFWSTCHSWFLPLWLHALNHSNAFFSLARLTAWIPFHFSFAPFFPRLPLPHPLWSVTEYRRPSPELVFAIYSCFPPGNPELVWLCDPDKM